MRRQCHTELVPEKQGYHSGAEPIPGTWCLDLGSAAAGPGHSPVRTGAQPSVFLFSCPGQLGVSLEE